MCPLRGAQDFPHYWHFDRLWLPQAHELEPDGEGFLPRARWQRTLGYPEPQPLRAWKEAPCVVALGDPHLGKSSALRDYVAQLGQTVSADRIVAQNLADFQSTTELQQQVLQSAAIESWTTRTDTVWLVLDSLDEVRMRMETVAGVLLEELQALFARLSTARLRVVIACRPLVIPPWFLERLRDVVETFAGGANAPASRPAADAEEADDNSAEWAEAPHANPRRRRASRQRSTPRSSC